jgi:hypothetical protein
MVGCLNKGVGVKTEDRVKVYVKADGRVREVDVKHNTPLPQVYTDLKNELFASSDAVVLQAINSVNFYSQGSKVASTSISSKGYDSQNYVDTFNASYTANTTLNIDELRLAGGGREYYSVQISPLSLPPGSTISIQWTVRWFLSIAGQGGFLSNATPYIQGLLLAIIMRLAGQFPSSIRVAKFQAYYSGNMSLEAPAQVDPANNIVKTGSITAQNQIVFNELYIVNSGGYKLLGFILPKEIVLNPGDQLSTTLVFSIY